MRTFAPSSWHFRCLRLCLKLPPPVLRDTVIRNASHKAVGGVYVAGDYTPLWQPPVLFGCLSNASRCGGVHFENVSIDDTAFGHPRDFLAVGWRGRPKHDGSVWTGHRWSHYVSGLGAIDLSGDMTVPTPGISCPSICT